MKQGVRHNAPALAVSLLALFVALGGTVYAAAKIDGRTIRTRSLPGNRVKPRSIPANRLKPGVLKGARLTGPLTGAEINEVTPRPGAERRPRGLRRQGAERRRRPDRAQRGQRRQRGERSTGTAPAACPGPSPSPAPAGRARPAKYDATAAEAAVACADQGGTLPEALQLAAFAQQPGVTLAEGDEWSGDLTNCLRPRTRTGSSTVSDSGGSRLSLCPTKTPFRCVIPLVT